MKNLFITLSIFLAIGINMSCSGQNDKNNKAGNAVSSKKVDVYYFHYTRRCATCNAVENVSKDAVNELYGNKVTFTGYNLDEEKGKSKGEELQVSGQTLLIVCGDKKINITNEGFMNARNNPEKLKAIIKEKIDPLL